MTLLDVTGLKCPLPVLRANKALKALKPGEQLEVRATDPNTKQDFVTFCRTAGHELVETAEAEGIFHFVIRKR